MPRTSVHGNTNLDDTIQRLVAYEKAGADVLFAPALPDLTAVRAVCAAVSKPVNFMVGIKGKSFTVAELTEAGVKRISFGASFHRAAMTALVNAAREVKEHGTFHYLDRTLTKLEMNRFLTGVEHFTLASCQSVRRFLWSRRKRPATIPPCESIGLDSNSVVF